MTLLKPSNLHSFQRECILHTLHHDHTMLWLQMGLGKTIITLTAIAERMRAGTVKKVLIFGPLRVVQSVWSREARRWEHTSHLKFSIIVGTKEKRGRALFAEPQRFNGAIHSFRSQSVEFHIDDILLLRFPLLCRCASHFLNKFVSQFS